MKPDMLPPRPLWAVIFADGYRYSVHNERHLAESSRDKSDLIDSLRVVKYLPVKSRRKQPEAKP